MAFVPKEWKNGEAGKTPISAAALIDLETRLAAYTDGGTDYKASVRVCATANVTISTALISGAVLDGVTLATGDRVLVPNQTTTKENGIYVVSASPTRSTDADAAGELSGGTMVYVESGTIYGGRIMRITTAGSITPGTTAHTWAVLTPKDHGIVEALPTTAALKGDTCTYVADKTNGVKWQLIYDGEGEFPWKKIGGPELYAEVVTDQTTTSTSYANLTTVGPSITVPLKGDYNVEIGADVFGGSPNNKYMSYAIGGTAAADENAIRVSTGGTTVIPGARRRLKAGLAAATALVAKYRCETASEASFGQRWMIVDPVRVG